MVKTLQVTGDIQGRFSAFGRAVKAGTKTNLYDAASVTKARSLFHRILIFILKVISWRQHLQPMLTQSDNLVVEFTNYA
ncbi:hypothetical protein [Rhodoferax sp.]|uniref:hypothetical protein n=1 Tax=Rhodoferax sp. TaxID=50421 RepID=UPI00284231AD|nr:hypothetical protein [Rhodoferax sp.]MDR3368088.1 hypothetical protein [Rhodoferax sp.]